MDLLPRHITATLSVIDGSDKGKSYPLQKLRTIFGRKDGDIVLTDTKISGRHFSIEYINGHFFLTDLGSTNGTFLNRARIREAMLNNMDEIQIGFSTMVFQFTENQDLLRILDLGRNLNQGDPQRLPAIEQYRNVPNGTMKVGPGMVPGNPYGHGGVPQQGYPSAAQPQILPPGYDRGAPQYPDGQQQPFEPPQGRRIYPDLDYGQATRKVNMPPEQMGYRDQDLADHPAPPANEQQGNEQSVRGRMMNQPLNRSLGIPKIKLYLEVVKGNDEGKKIRFDKSSMVIGRVNADINLRDTDVSRRHALIEVYGRDQVFIRDLASTNGTFVNGQPVNNYKLSFMDEIRVGRTVLHLRIEEH